MPHNFKHKAENLPCSKNKSRIVGDFISFNDALSMAYRKHSPKLQDIPVGEIQPILQTAPDFQNTKEFPTLSRT